MRLLSAKHWIQNVTISYLLIIATTSCAYAEKCKEVIKCTKENVGAVCFTEPGPGAGGGKTVQSEGKCKMAFNGSYNCVRNDWTGFGCDK